MSIRMDDVSHHIENLEEKALIDPINAHNQYGDLCWCMEQAPEAGNFWRSMAKW